MAAPFITVSRTDTNATHAGRVLSIQSRVRDLMSDIEEFIAESFQMFDGVGAEQFTLPKTKYGVSTNAEAQIVFDLLNGTLAALKGTDENANAVELSTRIG
jgi:hypothetical protein